MFTGIIEHLGTLTHRRAEGSNLHLTIASPISHELKIDQSVSHNGVCLTVVAQNEKEHIVTAVEETLKLTTLGHLKVGDSINLERAMSNQARLDGHIVQGHVDLKATCEEIIERGGSWYFHFSYDKNPLYILVPKGSICVNGVSLTVVEPSVDTFKVAIIPYTYEHTTFKTLKVGEEVNLEFDVIGKYVAQYLDVYKKHFDL